MGLMLDTEFVYDFPEQENGKYKLLQRAPRHPTTGFSGKVDTIDIVPVDLAVPPDSIFRRGPLTFSDYQRGYKPLVLGPSVLREAAAQVKFREINIDACHLPITNDGKIRIPVELAPLRSQFQLAAGVFSGITGPLQENWLLTLGLKRSIIRFPGHGSNDLPHCDYPGSKTGDGVGLKTKNADLPPQLAIISSTIVGTDFYPSLALTNIVDFDAGGKPFPASTLRDLGIHSPVIKVRRDHNTLMTDLHVHAGPSIDRSDAPIKDQFSWAEVEIEGARATRRSGMAVIRDVFHLVCERR